MHSSDTINHPAAVTPSAESTLAPPFMPSILIADDHPLFRAALREAAATAVADAQVAEAENLAGALAHLERDAETDLVLLDLHMADSRGLAGLIAVRTQFPGVAVLVVSAHDDAAVVRRTLDHGAAGFMPKSASPAEIAAAIRSVLACGRWIPPRLSNAVAAIRSDPDDTALAARLATLTGQQFRVLGMLAEGLLNKQIADALAIQERTVKAHVSAIFEKLGVRNRTQAGVLLRRLELGSLWREPA
jgi:DNA-binding NarL/FixJ family response regulator